MNKIIFIKRAINSAGILLFLLFSFCISLTAVTASRDTVLHVQKTSDFKLGGTGNDEAWKITNWIKLTKEGKGVEYETEIKILYSDSGIYCFYKCQDTQITATLKGDFLDLYNEDVVEAFFWPDDTIPIYFEYELSPLNFELPILVPNMKGRFWGWRPWHYEGERKTRHNAQIITDPVSGKVNGWTAEFFIPFKLLKPLTKVPPVKGTSWHANFYRIDYDKPDNEWFWQPVRVNFHDYKRFGKILFD